MDIDRDKRVGGEEGSKMEKDRGRESKKERRQEKDERRRESHKKWQRWRDRRQR